MTENATMQTREPTDEAVVSHALAMNGLEFIVRHKQQSLDEVMEVRKALVHQIEEVAFADGTGASRSITTYHTVGAIHADLAHTIAMSAIVSNTDISKLVDHYGWEKAREILNDATKEIAEHLINGARVASLKFISHRTDLDLESAKKTLDAVMKKAMQYEGGAATPKSQEPAEEEAKKDS